MNAIEREWIPLHKRSDLSREIVKSVQAAIAEVVQAGGVVVIENLHVNIQIASGTCVTASVHGDADSRDMRTELRKESK